MSFLEPRAFNARYRARKGAPPDPFELDRRLRVVLAEQASQTLQEDRGWSKAVALSYQHRPGSIPRCTNPAFDDTRSLETADLCRTAHLAARQSHEPFVKFDSSYGVAFNQRRSQVPRQTTAMHNPKSGGDCQWVPFHQKCSANTRISSHQTEPAAEHLNIWWIDKEENIAKGHAKSDEPPSQLSDSSDECSKIELESRRTLWYRLVPLLAKRNSVWVLSSKKERFHEKTAECNTDVEAPMDFTKGRRFNILARLRRLAS